MSASSGLPLAVIVGAGAMSASVARELGREHEPLRREGEMREIAETLRFLASPAASFITGTDILVDGGLVAAVRTPQDSQGLRQAER